MECPTIFAVEGHDVIRHVSCGNLFGDFVAFIGKVTCGNSKWIVFIDVTLNVEMKRFYGWLFLRLLFVAWTRTDCVYNSRNVFAPYRNANLAIQHKLTKPGCHSLVRRCG